MVTHTAPRLPNAIRTAQVYEMLDRAWAEGKRQQFALRRFVRDATGTACSPKLIAKWKQTRHIPLGPFQSYLNGG